MSLSAALSLLSAGRVCVLTGAGVSTDSGIPDYRGPGTAQRARNPIQFRDFVRSDAVRRRYWARSMVGFPRIARARPNASHEVLARFEARGQLTGLITQNVDGLHAAAGTRTQVELHGRLHEVVCLRCGEVGSRVELQAELEALNPDFRARYLGAAPDGDADLDDATLGDFRVVTCRVCAGDLKPHVVFFGENVPAPRVADAFARLDQARALFVLGSSLTVYSGLRFVRRANERAMPVVIVNLGETRGDPLATHKLDAPVAEVLAALERALDG